MIAVFLILNSTRFKDIKLYIPNLPLPHQTSAVLPLTREYVAPPIGSLRQSLEFAGEGEEREV